MKEYDNNKIHISSIFIISICLLIMLDALFLRPSLHFTTSIHFTTLHPTTLHYTYRHFSSSSCTLHRPPIWRNFTALPYGVTNLHSVPRQVPYLDRVSSGLFRFFSRYWQRRQINTKKKLTTERTY